jgi:hypothetical protein
MQQDVINFANILCVRGVEKTSYCIHHSGGVNAINMLETNKKMK